MNQLKIPLGFLLTTMAFSSLKAEEPKERFRVGLVASFPISDFKDSTSSAGPGISAGWSFWTISPNTSAGMYLENGWYSADSGTAVLTNLGFEMRSRLNGGFYDRYGIGAVRVKAPTSEATIKLGGVFGFGYRFSDAVGIELYGAFLASSQPPASTLNMAVVWNF
ncbi:hypothetical protein [Geothrix paludis]|uniref:hypothetical protein n=1 Tax=Geothrix paludis TaxID=2922722 RepID=UPI001FAE4238|nr:hypothetical protein [Geothrix paludis]